MKNSETKLLLQDYEIIEKLGEGAFGKVYKAKEKSSNRIFAIKQIIEGEDPFGGISTTTLRELSILSTLKHPNIIKYLRFFLFIFSYDIELNAFFIHLQ